LHQNPTLLKRLDHVSIAVDNIEDGYKIFRNQLGGEIIRKKTIGYNGTFSWTELILGGAKIELIQPEGDNSFVREFLKQGGSRMHHLTFEVENLDEAIKILDARGFKIVGKTMDDPEWKMAFIHPKSAKGVLIQIFEPKAK